jgi:hypothetical protein
MMIASIVPLTHPASKSKNVLSLFLLAGLLATPAWAQTQLGTLFGTVTDTSGAVVPVAEVSVENVSTGLKREGRTDKTGEYQLAGLPTGTYTLRVGKEGFQTEVREGIAVSPGAAIAINLSLVVGQLSEHVTIEAGVPALDTTSASVRGMIAERSLTELPLDGRDLFKTAVLQPGTAPTPSSAPSLLSNGKAGQVFITVCARAGRMFLSTAWMSMIPCLAIRRQPLWGFFLGWTSSWRYGSQLRPLAPSTVRNPGA